MPVTDEQPGSNGRSIDWEAEIAAHRGWLRTVIYARLGESSAVDDVLQEVSLAVVGTSSPVASHERIPAWLHRIAVRQTLLHRRKMGRERRRRHRYVERQTSNNGNSKHGDPLDWLLADERAEMVHQALRLLPPRERELLLLKYTENWTYRELAERLNLTQSAVEARLHRARQHLRDKLAVLNVTERD